MPKKVTTEEFNNIIKSNKVVLVDFSAAWCGPCQMMAPVVEDIKKEYEKNDKVEIIAIDIDENPEIAAKYSVMSVPTFLLIKKEEVLETVIGAVAKDILLEKIEKLSK